MRIGAKVSGILFLFLWVIATGVAQNLTIIGKVLDASGQPMLGATIRAVGSKIGTTTNNDGTFRLVLPAPASSSAPALLKVSFIGYKTQDIRYTGQQPLVIRLREDSQQIKEVVVTARPNINAIDMRSKTGVVSSVDMKELLSKPMIDLSSALQGSVPGLVVINRGELGTKPEIRIRGNSSFRPGDTPNEPLYVLDGQVISSEAFVTLNPLDIREIKVLKDAIATALYGVKAANGVVEISSKRGRSGPMQVSISSNMGITTKGNRGVRMMETAEKLEMERRVRNLSAPGYFLSADYINSTSISNIASLYYQEYGLEQNWSKDQYLSFAQGKLDSLSRVNTDWFNELIRNNYYQSHNLSIRGGSSDLTYYVSANYSRQGGQIEGNSTQRFTGRMSLDWQNRLGYLSLSTNAGYSSTNSPNSSTISPAEMVARLNPYESKDSPKLYSYPKRKYADLSHEYSSTNTDKRFGTTLSLNLKPLKGLLVDGVLGLDYVVSDQLSITSPNAYEQKDYLQIARGKIVGGKGSTLNYTANLRLTYSREWNDLHDLSISANSDYYYNWSDMLSATGYGAGIQTYLGATNHSLKNSFAPGFASNVMRSAQLGYGIAVGYTYDRTYDLSIAYKADASSILPKDKRWSYAWAGGLNINISQYPFLKGNKVLSQLSLKTSLGLTSSLAGVDAASTIPIFSYSDNSYGQYFRQLSLSKMYNRDLKPESVFSIDLGLSVGLWSKYNINLQAYRRTTREALLGVSIPTSNGFSSMIKNIGVLQNQGLELSVSAELLRWEDISLSLRGSIAYNENTVVSLYGGKTALYLSPDAKYPDYEVGKPLNTIYGINLLGIHPLLGVPIYQTARGEEKQFTENIAPEDFHFLGYSTPPYQGTIGLSFGWGNLSIDAQLYYVLGGIKPYDTQYIRDAQDLYRNTEAGLLEQTWFKPGDEHKLYPSPQVATSVFNAYHMYRSNRFVSSSDYLRLSMLSVNYRIPARVLRGLGGFISYASIAFQGSNLLTLSPYRASNPEAGRHNIAVQPVYTMNLNLNF